MGCRSWSVSASVATVDHSAVQICLGPSGERLEDDFGDAGGAGDQRRRCGARGQSIAGEHLSQCEEWQRLVQLLLFPAEGGLRPTASPSGLLRGGQWWPTVPATGPFLVSTCVLLGLRAPARDQAASDDTASHHELSSPSLAAARVRRRIQSPAPLSVRRHSRIRAKPARRLRCALQASGAARLSIRR